MCKGPPFPGSMDGSCSLELGSSRVTPRARLYDPSIAFDYPPFWFTVCDYSIHDWTRTACAARVRRQVHRSRCLSCRGPNQTHAILPSRICCCIDCLSTGSNPLHPGIGRHVKVMPAAVGFPDSLSLRIWKLKGRVP